MGYGDFQKSVSAPSWMLQPRGRKWLEGLGAMKDAVGDQARQAVKAAFPSLCPPDALALIAESRQMEQYPSESLATFRERVRLAWDTWRDAGTPLGILRELFLFLGPLYIPTVTGLVQLTTRNGLRYTYDETTDAVIVDKTGWNRHFQEPDIWNTFMLTFNDPNPWGGSIPADGSDTADTVARILGRWKPAHAICSNIVVMAATGPVWGGPTTDGTSRLWGVPEVWGSTGNVHWTPP